MSQARVLNPQELRRVLDYVATRRHSTRNRVMLLLTHYAGMRVGEVAALRLNDVLNSDSTIKDEVRLLPEQTKGKHARTVYLNERIRKEISQYLRVLRIRDASKPLFYTQKQAGFSANSLAQYFFYLYRNISTTAAYLYSSPTQLKAAVELVN